MQKPRRDTTKKPIRENKESGRQGPGSKRADVVSSGVADRKEKTRKGALHYVKDPLVRDGTRE